MTSSAWLHLAIAAVLALTSQADDILVGYIVSDHGINRHPVVKNSQARLISGAMTYALDVINADPRLLPGHQLRLDWEQTEGSVLVGTRRIVEMWNRSVVAYFGPDETCEVEARVASALNLPMISYVSVHHCFIGLLR